jgi:hypothetical protein
MNLDNILNYFDLHSFFPFFSIILGYLQTKENTKRNATKAVIQVAITIKGKTLLIIIKQSSLST